MQELKHDVAVGVGLYDTVIGLWPLLSMKTFTAVTGLKGPVLLIKGIGASWALLGVALLLSNRNRKLIRPLGIASTVAGSTLAITQVILVATKIISPIFLIQALAETTIGLTWMTTLTRNRDDDARGVESSSQNAVA